MPTAVSLGEGRAVPPDNNRAERELRPTVIAVKSASAHSPKPGLRTRES